MHTMATSTAYWLFFGLAGGISLFLIAVGAAAAALRRRYPHARPWHWLQLRRLPDITPTTRWTARCVVVFGGALLTLMAPVPFSRSPLATLTAFLCAVVFVQTAVVSMWIYTDR